MRAEEGDESIDDYAREAHETKARVGRPSWRIRLLNVRGMLSAFRRRH